MNNFIIIVIVALMAMVVFSLVRGLIAFLKQTEEDLNNPEGPAGPAMQNKMMFARVKYQALAIVALVVLMLANQ